MLQRQSSGETDRTGANDEAFQVTFGRLHPNISFSLKRSLQLVKTSFSLKTDLCRKINLAQTQWSFHRKSVSGEPRPQGRDALKHDQRAQAASTSATVFGVVMVIFSLPVAVIRTSSSIRIPMFQKCSGTSLSGRM